MRIALAAGLLAAALAPPAGAAISKELILSSAWCTFTYNKISGHSNTKRFVYNANGTWSMGGRREGGSSGPHGSVYGQSDAQNGGRWGVQAGELYMSEGAGPAQLVQTVVKRNSSGYPIVVADGVEYSQCR